MAIMNRDEFLERYSTERRDTHSVKWDALGQRYGQADLLPIWIADMDFKVADSITTALTERVQHGVYGYSVISDAYIDAYNHWMTSRFNFPIEREWLRYTPGVVQSIYNCIHAFTQKGDAILIQSPVYTPFFSAIKETERCLVDVALLHEDGRYSIDFVAFEEAIVAHQVTAYIHCSPHNPVGRVWTEEEQLRLLEICERYDVLLISDEIHQDFAYGSHRQIPSATLADGKYRHRIVTLNSATKTFNIASLTHSTIILTDDKLRQQYDETVMKYHHADANLMGVIATQAGFEGGSEWLSALHDVILYNYDLLQNKLKATLPEIEISELEGTYLVFINLNPILKGRSPRQFVQNLCQLAVGYGETFGKSYRGYIRVNLATHPRNIEEVIQRILTHV